MAEKNRKMVEKLKKEQRKLIEQALKSQGKNLDWLAENTGISKFSLMSYLCGKIDFYDSQKSKILTALKLNVPNGSSTREVVKSGPIKKPEDENASDHNAEEKEAKTRPSEPEQPVSEDKETEKPVKEESVPSQIGNGPAAKYPHVGDMLKFYRLKKNITSEKAASQIGVNEDVYNKYEAGEEFPSQDSFFDLVKFYNIKEMEYSDGLSEASDKEKREVVKKARDIRLLRIRASVPVPYLASSIKGTSFEVECYENGYAKVDEEIYEQIIHLLTHILKAKGMSITFHNEKEEVIAKEFGQFLHGLRVKKSISLTRILKAMKMKSTSTICFIEGGQRLPSLQFILGAAECLQIPAEELYSFPGLQDAINGNLYTPEQKKTASSKKGRQDTTGKSESVKPVKLSEKAPAKTTLETVEQDANSALAGIAMKFGITREEFINGLKNASLSLKDEATGKMWVMAPSEEELVGMIHRLSRNGRIEAGKVLKDLLEKFPKEEEAC